MRAHALALTIPRKRTNFFSKYENETFSVEYPKEFRLVPDLAGGAIIKGTSGMVDIRYEKEDLVAEIFYRKGDRETKAILEAINRSIRLK